MRAERFTLAHLNATKYIGTLPRLTDEERSALESSGGKCNGFLDPLLIDENLCILDGFERHALLLAKKAKHCECVIVKGLSEAEKIDLILEKNLARRHLNGAAKRLLVSQVLKRNPKRADREIGTLVGVDHKTVGAVRREMQVSGEIPQINTIETTRNGKPLIFTRASGRVGSAGTIARDLNKLVETPKSAGFPHSKNELGRKVAQEIQEQNQRPCAYTIAGQQIHIPCDLHELQKVAGFRDGSVNMVFVDPMYDAKHVKQYGEIMDLAERWLAPHGVLAMYGAIDYMDDIFAMYNARKRAIMYRTQAICLWNGRVTIEKRGERCGGGQGKHGGRRGAASGENMGSRVEPNYTPLWIFAKDSCRFLEVLKGVYQAPEGNKPDYYPFQKPVSEAAYFIRALTKPGELVVDCCMGSGTVAIACDKLGRRFIGGDANSKCLNIYRNRAKDWADRKIDEMDLKAQRYFA